jgi:hypothetical protein
MFPINSKIPRQSTVWFVASLSLTLWLAFGRHSTQPQPAQASVNSTALKAPSRSTAKPVSRVKPISEAQLGERTIGKNPLREQVDEELLEPDQRTWRKLTLRLPKENGKWLTVELLRPLDWIEDEEAAVGESIFLDLEEMGAIGDADVVSIEPCPPIQPGNGNVITGRFIHEVDQGEVIELRFVNQPEPTRVTRNHPYWSVDRQQFVPAAELREGEQVESLTGPTHVASITPSDYSGPVYNLEINGEHVFRVGTKGLLAHNSCSRTAPKSKPINLPSPKKVTIDMNHIASGHMTGGSRVGPRKDLFPSSWTRDEVRRAVQGAYGNAKRIGTQGERVRLQGSFNGTKIEMWFNKITNIIETAYPK